MVGEENPEGESAAEKDYKKIKTEKKKEKKAKKEKKQKSKKLKKYLCTIITNRMQSIIGSDNYRFSLCILFSNKRMTHDYEQLKMMAKKYNVSGEKHTKIEAMMIAKCNKSMPINLTKKVTMPN